jgi:hypothetical protein
MLSGAVTALGNFAQQSFENIGPRRKLSAFCGKNSEIPRAGGVAVDVVRR